MLSPNITPDPGTGIGRWSANDFYKALHHGVNMRGQDMYPTMPYDFYTRVTRDDINAIFAYLRTVKPVRNAVDVNHLEFPFNIRMSMLGWRELYFREGTLKPDPAKTARMAWADLLKRVFEVDALRCPTCGGRMRVLAAITDPDVARKILECLAQASRAPPLAADTANQDEPAIWSEQVASPIGETQTDPGFNFDQSPAVDPVLDIDR